MQYSLANLSLRSRSWLDIAGLLVVAVVLAITGWLPGLVLGGLLFASWWWLPPEYTFTGGQFALIGVGLDSSLNGLITASPPSSGIGLLVLSEAGLLVPLLTQHSSTSHQSYRFSWTGGVISIVAVSIGVVSCWLLLQQVDTLWVAAAGLGLGGCVLAYCIRRYERWTLGELDPIKQSETADAHK